MVVVCNFLVVVVELCFVWRDVVREVEKTAVIEC